MASGLARDLIRTATMLNESSRSLNEFFNSPRFEKEEQTTIVRKEPSRFVAVFWCAVLVVWLPLLLEDLV